MSYFLYDGVIHNQALLVIENATAHHLKVRRVKVGERFNLQDTHGERYECEVISFSKQNLTVKPLRPVPVPRPPKVPVVLFQAMLMETALDWVLQKSTELGVSKIVLFNAERTAVKFNQQKINQKFNRWNKIVTEATKQCDRAIPPELEYAKDSPEVIKKTEVLQKILVCDIFGKALNPQEAMPNSIGLMVGPEGGFSPEELATLKQHPQTGFIKLAENTLRAETASVAGLALILNTHL